MPRANKKIFCALKDPLLGGEGLEGMLICLGVVFRDEVCKLLTVFLFDVDAAMRAVLHEDMHVNQNRIKTILTSFGNIEILATVFHIKDEVQKKKNGKKNVKPLTEALGISDHQRVSFGLQEDLVDAAIRILDSIAAELVANGYVTKQTVACCIDRIPEPECPERWWNQETIQLYVIADENHIPLQKGPNGKKCRYLPWVSLRRENARTDGEKHG